jgi:hypothetical protein
LLRKVALAVLPLSMGGLSGCASSEASMATRRALLRHASLRGIEAKTMVGKTIDEAIAKYGRAVQVLSSPANSTKTYKDIPVAGKDLYLFERDRTHYTIDVARGTEVAQSAVGPVQVQRYERESRVALCHLGFLVDPATRLILAYDISGNCL